MLDRLPTFVGDEQVGDSPAYRVAAAPVRTSGREGVVTVALTNRQQEIEQQIDELDRRVLSGVVLFTLLGAALGYWMAERIADPVNRLTRATRRNRARRSGRADRRDVIRRAAPPGRRLQPDGG